MKPVVAYVVVSAARGWDAKLKAHDAANAVGLTHDVRTFRVANYRTPEGAKATADAIAAALATMTQSRWRVLTRN